MTTLKGLLSKKEFDKKVQVYEGTKKVDVTLGKRVKFVCVRDNKGAESLALKRGEDQWTLGQAAFCSIVKHIGLSPAYASTVPANLIVSHLNYWYSDKKEDETLRLMVRDHTALAATMKGHVDFVSLMQVVNLFIKEVGEQGILGYHKVSLGWETSCLSIVRDVTLETVKGDVMNGGIRVEHSITGMYPTKVCAYMFRQTCSNGAITMDTIQSWSRRNSGDSLLSWAREVIPQVEKAFGMENDRLKKLREIKIEKEASAVLNGILEADGVPKALREEVRNAIIDTEVATLYDVYNVLTRVSTHSTFFEKHPGAMRALETVAGRLSLNPRLCTTCHRKLPTVKN